MKTFFKILFIYFIITQSLFSAQITLTDEEEKWLKKNPVIKIGATLQFEPLYIKTNDGTITGITADTYNLIAKKLGIKLDFVVDDWANIITKIENKEIDFIGVMNKKTAINENLIPLDSATDHLTTIFAKRSRNFNIEYDNDVKKLRVAYFKSTFYIDKYFMDKKEKDNLILLREESPLSALKAVLDGKADIMVGFNLDSYLLTKHSIVELEPIYNYKNLAVEAVSGVRSDYPKLASILKKGIDSLSLSEKNKILEKWIRTIEPKKTTINLNKKEKDYLKKNKKLRVQNLSTFPPFNFNENNIPLGYTIDYMKLMAQQLNIELEFISDKPWREYLQMMKENTLDIIPHIAVTKEREEFIEFTNFNHIEYVTGLAVKKSDKFTSMLDLKDKVIAVANKTFLHTHLKNKFPNQSLLLASSTSMAVQAVSEGKADAVIGSLPALQYYIQKNWLSNIKTQKINGLELKERTKLPMGVVKGNYILKSILEKTNRSIPYNQIVELKEKWLTKLDITHLKNSSLIKKELDYLENKKVIKMCVLPDWLPFEQIDENGKHKGIGNDIMKIVSKYIDTPIELVVTKQWSQSLQNIRDRKCDILPVAMDIPSRRDAMNFTKHYVAEPFVIATKSDKLFIKDEKSLSHKKIGIVASYAFIEVMKAKNPDIEIIEVKNTKEGLEKVSSGELFGYLDTMPTVGYFIQKYGMLDLKIAGRLDYDIKLSVASRNDEPILNTIIQKALDTISQEEMRKIVGRWIEIKVQQEFDYRNFFYIIIAFGIILILILYRNRMINKANKKLEKANTQILQQQKMVDKYVQILTTNLKGEITSVNDAYCNTIGYSKEELIGNSFDILRHSDMKKEFFSILWKTIKKENIWSGEIKNLSKDGQDLYFNVVIEALYEEDKKVGYRSISEDITDKKRIEELSITDKLTGLNNRLKIDELLINHIDLYKRYNTPFSIILLDIDDFKKVNDTYGHDIGDYVLQEMAKILQNHIRITDEVGRWGGEEFIVICSNADNNSSFIVAEHIRKAIENFTFTAVGEQTVSLGVSEFIKDDTISSLFKRVDTNLYQAKKEGKNKTIKS